MMSTSVLDPSCRFTELSESYARSGWDLADRAADPILPEEPEFAVFERGADRVVYTFNPVCLLRVLDWTGVADAEQLPALPVVTGPTVGEWLAAEDERTVLRGILAAGVLSEPDLAADVGAHRSHPRATIAAAAARVADDLAGVAASAEAELLAQARALAAVDVLKEQLTPFLLELARNRDQHLIASLRPRPDDYAKAFRPEAVAGAREAYEALWATPPRLGPVSPHPRLECHIAPAGMLGYDNLLSRHFPGGYQAIASLLHPERVWVGWKVIEPGQSAGTAYDGLVWLEDHWTWFPRPHRVLRSLLS
jgi:hypothetical protein